MVPPCPRLLAQATKELTTINDDRGVPDGIVTYEILHVSYSNMKFASSSFEPLMLVVFPEICKQTDTQYDYHTLLPTLHGEGKYYKDIHVGAFTIINYWHIGAFNN